MPDLDLTDLDVMVSVLYDQVFYFIKFDACWVIFHTADFFSELVFSKYSFRKTIRVSNSLDSDPGPVGIKLFSYSTQLSTKFTHNCWHFNIYEHDYKYHI